MREIVKMTKHIVAQAKNYESDTIPGDFATLTARCPKCGGEVHENYKKFQCQSLRLRLLEDHGRPPARARRGRDAAVDARSRSARRLPQQDRAGRSRRSCRLNDANEVQFDFGPTRR